MLRKFLFILFFFTLGVTATSYTQDLSSIDFSKIRVEQISDQQLQQFWARAQERGLSIEQVGQLAQARGMSSGEVNRLKSRLRDLQLQSGNKPSDQLDSRRMRQVPDWYQADSLMTRKDSLSLMDSLFAQPVDSVEMRRRELRKRIYGYSLFNKAKVTFTPSLNIPTPEDYELGPGDEIIIDIWGAAENTYQLSISPEGTIQISNLGPIYLNGLTIEQAEEKLRKELSRIYAGLKHSADSDQPAVFFKLSLGSVRSINVHMVGEVNTPGTYTIPSLATVFNALYAAGGPSVNGTFRAIEVIRNNKTIATFDIYDFLVDGDQSDNVRLQDQDIIKIRPYKNRVELIGYAKQTGLFELKDGETLGDLLQIAGGFAEKAYKHRVKITRSGDRQKSVYDVAQAQFDRFELQNGDQVKINKIIDRFSNRVEIKGAVYRPGIYQLTDSTTLYSLIKRAEGIKEDAFMNRGLIYRLQPDLTLSTISFDIRALLNNPEAHDIALQREDVIQISSIFDLRENYQVTVEGAVNNPGPYKFAEGMTLEDAILQADGFRESASALNIEVSRRVTDVTSTEYTDKIANIYTFSVNESLEMDDEASSFVLQPFDKVFVRRAPNYETQQDVKIGGQVLYPGTYTLKTKTERISDLIDRSGGLTPDAYPEGATLYRQTMVQRTDIAVNLREGDSVDASKLETQGTADLTSKRKLVIDKVGIQLDEIMRDPGSKQDLILQEGDSLAIPKELQTIRVKGSVLYPITIRYEKGKGFKHYISSAGGFATEAIKRKSYIVYANGEVDRTRTFLFLRNYPKVEPGATIVVPNRAEAAKLSTQERISIFSSIISMAAIVATTLNQITR
jgi:protein involved in polysaccharide export with SLBB domain